MLRRILFLLLLPPLGLIGMLFLVVGVFVDFLIWLFTGEFQVFGGYADYNPPYKILDSILGEDDDR